MSRPVERDICKWTPTSEAGLFEPDANTNRGAGDVLGPVSMIGGPRADMFALLSEADPAQVATFQRGLTSRCAW
jgi:hypothetical protein